MIISITIEKNYTKNLKEIKKGISMLLLINWTENAT